MVYILPVSHDLKVRLRREPEALLDRISKILGEYGIDFITEENHPDQLEDEIISPIGKFAQERQCPYAYLDPSDAEEKVLEIPSAFDIFHAENTAKRRDMLLMRERKKEEFWLPQLVRYSKIHKNVLLICGSNHVSTNPDAEDNGIDRLLQEYKVQFMVLENFELD